MLKEIKSALNTLSNKPIYTKVQLSHEIIIMNNKADNQLTIEVIYKNEVILSVRNIFITTKERSYAATYIYNKLTCKGII